MANGFPNIFHPEKPQCYLKYGVLLIIMSHRCSPNLHSQPAAQEEENAQEEEEEAPAGPASPVAEEEEEAPASPVAEDAETEAASAEEVVSLVYLCAMVFYLNRVSTVYFPCFK
jgi:hypothetical protein